MSKGGPSIVITADQHDATRLARKAAQRRNHGTGRRVADGTDILTLARQDRIMRAREAREAELHTEHVALIAYLESTIRSMRLMGTNASTTEIVQMTIDGFLTEFDRADPKAYKALGEEEGAGEGGEVGGEGDGVFGAEPPDEVVVGEVTVGVFEGELGFADPTKSM